MFPPAKNENKFIYGILIQMAFVELLNGIFHKCVDLDNECKVGSQYKVDCKLNLTNYLHRNISIKAKKNKKSKTIIINKNSNNINHNLSGLITAMIIIETENIIIIPHNVIPKKFIEYNESNISYKSSLITFLQKNKEYNKYIINLVRNNEYKLFYNNIFPLIKSHNIYPELFRKL